ncbi:MAG: trypsin-like serine protease [Archangium sp.]|nr:trypsin-like serine protease [Archangium sp.]
MRTFRMLAVSMVLGACAPSVDLPARESRNQEQAVFNGTDAPNESQVFLLDVRSNTGNASICSAVLVSPRVLLTAAHCVDPAFLGAQSVTVRALNKPNVDNVMLSDTIVVLTIARHPMWVFTDMESDFDVAALLLTSAPMGVTPAPMASTFSNPVGSMVKVVGYGRLVENMPTTAGTRRSSLLTVTAETPLHFRYGDSMNGLCVGDSGGPSFLGNTVVGIHSRTPGSALCDEGIDIRVDAKRAFIDAFIAANDPARCTADGRCAAMCTTDADPDCTCVADGTCVGGCAQSDPDCAPCVMNGTCGAMCGVTDPDCCGVDGTCDAACGAADADCCATDGVCGVGCGASDSDCCATDGACGVGCGSSDGDCCATDGACDTACSGADLDCCRADGACVPRCGANDIDCCGTDGACDAACALADFDCRCSPIDGACGATCGASDPDCCQGDARCDLACGMTDPDCGGCVSDGRCVDGCSPADPDCCPADGQCNRECGELDRDCSPDWGSCTTSATCIRGDCVAGLCTSACGDDRVCIPTGQCVRDGSGNGHCVRKCSCSSVEGLSVVCLLLLALVRRRTGAR